jgi:hypothetical protein
MALIGVLAPRSAPNANDEVLWNELQNLDHVEGRDIRFEFRGVAGDPERLKSVGRKFGRWHDVAWYQRFLGDSPPFE